VHGQKNHPAFTGGASPGTPRSGAVVLLISKLAEPSRVAAMSNSPLPPEQRLGEGNRVLVVSEGSFAGAHSSFYDLFRVDQGKIAEH